VRFIVFSKALRLRQGLLSLRPLRILPYKLTRAIRIVEEELQRPRLNEIPGWENDPSLRIANRTIFARSDAEGCNRADECRTIVMVCDGFEDIDETSTGKQIAD